MLLKATKGLTALTPEMDCDYKAMGLPPIISAVFLITISVNYACLGRISEIPLLPLRG
jgi:hypothetical protein